MESRDLVFLSIISLTLIGGLYGLSSFADPALYQRVEFFRFLVVGSVVSALILRVYYGSTSRPVEWGRSIGRGELAQVFVGVIVLFAVTYGFSIVRSGLGRSELFFEPIPITLTGLPDLATTFLLQIGLVGWGEEGMVITAGIAVGALLFKGRDLFAQFADRFGSLFPFLPNRSSSGVAVSNSMKAGLVSTRVIWAGYHAIRAYQGDFSAAVTIFFAGLVLVWLFLRTGSIVAPTLTHGLYNGLIQTGFIVLGA